MSCVGCGCLCGYVQYGQGRLAELVLFDPAPRELGDLEAVVGLEALWRQGTGVNGGRRHQCPPSRDLFEVGGCVGIEPVQGGGS